MLEFYMCDQAINKSELKLLIKVNLSY